MTRQINIYHLYPAQLNLYGDRGNMLALCRRAEWHGIDLRIIAVEPGGGIDFEICDLLFMGGGQDSDQKLVATDLKSRQSEMRRAIEQGMPVFAVCGSYQLLGTYYTTAAGDQLGGLEILDLYTEAGEKRLIGNAVIRSSLWEPSRTLVGFENHAGKTYLGPTLQPLGAVITGFGNNGSEKKEGAVYKNVIGTYLHGSLLPKNPWLTDLLLIKALSYRNQDTTLLKLDDSTEEKAHQAAIYLAGSRRHKMRSTRA
jgi:lipid II isoglutaminyl synthase (glutamine-hydrolysing)